MCLISFTIMIIFNVSRFNLWNQFRFNKTIKQPFNSYLMSYWIFFVLLWTRKILIKFVRVFVCRRKKEVLLHFLWSPDSLNSISNAFQQKEKAYFEKMAFRWKIQSFVVTRIFPESSFFFNSTQIFINSRNNWFYI